MKIVFRPGAKADLSSLFEYIRETSGVARALAYVDRVEASCLGLADMPKRGMARPEFGQGVRELSLDRTVAVYYVCDDVQVEIISVFYGGRDAARHLADRLGD